MKILITGANGMVAKATAEYCDSLGDEVYALTRSELDITDTFSVETAIADIRPHAVINCAAYTDVDGAEAHAKLCYEVNAKGPENLANACRSSGSLLVTISSDFVFDGTYDGFYTQHDTPSPLGVYARSKYASETLVRSANARAIIVRSGWIFGEGGTNFLSLMPKLLAEGKSIKAISDGFGTPTFADDLARRLRELVDLDMPCLFHVINAGEGTSYLGFAEAVCRAGGFDESLIEPVLNQDLNRPAPRPASSKMRCLFSNRLGLSPLPDWQDAIARFVNH